MHLSYNCIFHGGGGYDGGVIFCNQYFAPPYILEASVQLRILANCCVWNYTPDELHVRWLRITSA